MILIVIYPYFVGKFLKNVLIYKTTFVFTQERNRLFVVMRDVDGALEQLEIVVIMKDVT
jgi:hypothetical protein